MLHKMAVFKTYSHSQNQFVFLWVCHNPFVFVVYVLDYIRKSYFIFVHFFVACTSSGA